MPGEHNRLNAAYALRALELAGFDSAASAEALAGFRGVGRRLEDHGEAGGVRLVDDYAHHPAELAATIAAARELAGEGRLVVLFQPHLYSRTLYLGRELGQALAAADAAVVTEIYPAREEPIAGVTAKLVVDRLLEIRPGMPVGWAPGARRRGPPGRVAGSPGRARADSGGGRRRHGTAAGVQGAWRVKEHVTLGRYTTLGTGGPARWFDTPETVDELVARLAWAESEGLPVAVVGLGSNVLVADEGFPGVALKLGGELARAEAVDGTLVAGGGAPLAVCLHRARAAELGGIEFVCAIPGTVGGGVWMNAGAYGGDIAAVLRRALVADASGADWRTPAELGLSYRSSGLRHGQVVAQAELALEPRPLEEIKKTVVAMQSRRKEAQPTNKRTFGSVFKNPEHELTAGRMLEACGLRGFVVGGAQISPKHANFIENAGEACSADAVALIAEARRRAAEQFGVVLQPEVQLLGSLEIPALDLRAPNAMRSHAAWSRWAARGGVLSRAHTSTGMNAPCVLASNHPAHPVGGPSFR